MIEATEQLVQQLDEKANQVILQGYKNQKIEENKNQKIEEEKEVNKEEQFIQENLILGSSSVVIAGAGFLWFPPLIVVSMGPALCTLVSHFEQTYYNIKEEKNRSSYNLCLLCFWMCSYSTILGGIIN